MNTTTTTTKTITMTTRNAYACGYGFGYAMVAAIIVGSLVSPNSASADDVRPCVTHSGMSVMFRADTTEAEAHEIAGGHISPLAFAVDGGTWDFTATDGSVQPGQAITLTYSFIPDGTRIFSSYADADTVSNMFATIDAGFPGGRIAWKQQFATAFANWSTHTNITYVEVSDDGAPLTSGAFGILNVRGDIRIGMHEIGGPPLAYNFYPVFGGDMVFDSLDMDTFTNPAANFRSLRNIIMHEHGHGMGMDHVIPGNSTKLMEPSLATAFDGPQEDDIRAAQFLYGDRDESNDTSEDARLIGETLRNPATNGVQTYTVEDIALERANSTDWYAFTAFSGVPITIRVQPVGTTYQYGPQDGVAQFVDARTVRDLSFRVWRRVSSLTGELMLMAKIDFNDAGEAEYHPPIPYTLAGYILVEIYSEDGIDDVQAYSLTISNSAIGAPVEPPVFSLDDADDPVTTTSTVFFDSANIGQTTSKALTIRNFGEGTLRFDGQPKATITGFAANDFEVQLQASEVAPDGFAVLGINFTPTQTGGRVAVLTIPNNDPDQSDFSFLIRGEGLAALEPAIQVEWENMILSEDDELDFGDITLGETQETTFTIRNLGEAPLNIAAIQFSGDAGDEYDVDLNATIIAPNGQRTGTLTVTPSGAGTRNAVVTIVSNATVANFELLLTTEGIADFVDCNENGIDDTEDVLTFDCNANDVPDECELDSDGDEIIDACDNCPDEVNVDQLDADSNGVGDACDDANDEPAENNDNDVDEDDVEDDDNDVQDNPNDVDNGEGIEDDGVNNDEVGQKDLDDEFGYETDNDAPGSVMCGAGVVGMIPAMMFGLSGMRSRRRK